MDCTDVLCRRSPHPEVQREAWRADRFLTKRFVLPLQKVNFSFSSIIFWIHFSNFHLYLLVSQTFDESRDSVGELRPKFSLTIIFRFTLSSSHCFKRHLRAAFQQILLPQSRRFLDWLNKQTNLCATESGVRRACFLGGTSHNAEFWLLQTLSILLFLRKCVVNFAKCWLKCDATPIIGGEMRVFEWNIYHIIRLTIFITKT